MSFRKRNILMVTLLLLSPAAFAADGGQGRVSMRTGEHAHYDRIVFDMPAGSPYNVRRSENRIIVLFPKASALRLGTPDLARAAGFRLLSQAPITVQFRIAADAKYKYFKNENSLVLDIYGARLTDAPKAKPVPKTQAQTKSKTKAKPLETKEKKPVKRRHALAPPPKSSPVKKVEAGKPLHARPKDLPPNMSAEMAARLIALSYDEHPHPVVSVEAYVNMGAAVFVRAGYITVLFDRKLAMKEFLEKGEEWLDIEPLELPYNSGFRLAVPPDVDVRANKKGTKWDIYLTHNEAGPAITTDFIVQPDFALGGRVLLPTTEPPDAVHYTDPIVGDKLLILPLQETGAFTVERHMADFDILAAAQGLVVKPWDESLVARSVPDGLELTTSGGLKLSPLRDRGELAQPEASGKESPLSSLFRLREWRGPEKSSFTETRQRLLQSLVGLPENKRLLARMDLARFYFANGLGLEAVSLLDLVAEDLPEAQDKADFVALRGAALILSGDIETGLKELSDSNFKSQPEAMLWRAIGEARSQKWADAADRFNYVFPLLEQYPEPFRSRFIVLAVESALASGKDELAEKWLPSLEGKDQVTAFYKPAVLYLRGVLSSKKNRIETAEKLWKKVVKGNNRLYKIRAELALVDLKVATKSITPKQAVDRLEGLRFAWRGDNLEFDILQRLGGFYVDAHDYRTGLLIYAQALRLFPTSPFVPGLRTEMRRVFTNLFLTETGDDLSPLEAYALYQDFKSLIPKGEEGVRLRRELAERLVDIDLLSQAGNLLEEVYKDSRGSKTRMQVALRLAAIRLLDHQAKEAYTVLDRAELQKNGFPDELLYERALLRARALSEMKRYNAALAALPRARGDDKKAGLLRADILMRAHRWKEASAELLSLIGPPPDVYTPLAEEKAEWILNAAVAMALDGDDEGLARLAQTYDDAMSQTKKVDVFHLLTRPDETGQLKDLTAAQKRLTEVDMFKGFLNSYRGY